MEEFNTSESKKIFRGAYEYFNGEQLYCEETFDIFRHMKELTTEFISESISRLPTGELLKIRVNYVVAKNWIPRQVTIKKSLGRNSIEEMYINDMRHNTLLHIFANLTRKSKDEQQLTTPPRFHIATPTTASSFLFLLSKKFNSTDRNDYSIYINDNQWEYVTQLRSQSASVEKLSTGDDTITVSGKQLLGTKYVLYETPVEQGPGLKEKYAGPMIQAFISKHLAIPYLLQSPDGNIVRIKYLNNLEEF